MTNASLTAKAWRAAKRAVFGPSRAVFIHPYRSIDIPARIVPDIAPDRRDNWFLMLVALHAKAARIPPAAGVGV